MLQNESVTRKSPGPNAPLSDRFADRIAAKMMAMLAIICAASFAINDLVAVCSNPNSAPFLFALGHSGFFSVLILLFEFLLPLSACICLFLALRQEDPRGSALFPVSLLLYAGFLLSVLLERALVNHVGDEWYSIVIQAVLLLSFAALAVLCFCKRENTMLTLSVCVLHLFFWVACGAACMGVPELSDAGKEIAAFSREGVIVKALRSGILVDGKWAALTAFIYLFQLLWPFLFLTALIEISLPRHERKRSLRMLIVLSMLTAMEIVFNRFLSFKTWDLKIGFSFIPVVVAAMLYGPLGGACVGALGDFIGAMLFPNGPFFPGFTFTALLTGAVYGLFLSKDLFANKKMLPVRVVLCVVINQLILSLLLNSYWISVLYGSPYVPLLGTRLIQCAILIPVQIVVIFALAPVMNKKKKSVRVS